LAPIEQKVLDHVSRKSHGHENHLKIFVKEETGRQKWEREEREVS
jgi:hypothetical protein